MKWTRLTIIFGLALFGLIALPAVSLAAGGSGPGDALIPTGAAQTLAAHAQTWYRFDYGGDKSTINVTLDSSGSDNLSFAVYTPEEIRAWQNGDALTAIGSSAKGIAHNLDWIGRFSALGTYYVVVTNNRDVTETYQLNAAGDNVTTVKTVAASATPMVNPFAVHVPVGSISGGKIVFQDSSGGNIYTVNADGSGLARVTNGLDPALSPDGQSLAFVRQGAAAGLYLANADGSNERLVYGANQVRSPSWSADGTRVVFTTVASTKGGNSVCFGSRCFESPETVIWKLKEYHVSGGTVTDVFTPPTGGVSPTYNADNNTIAFVGAEMGLMVTFSTNSYTPYVIAGDMRVTSASYNPLNISAPSYSPDGSMIAFVIPQTPSWQIAVAKADGSSVRLLTRMDPLDFVHPNNVAPVWSPDGKQILFLSNRNGKWEFFAINVDGTNEHQVLKSVTDQVTLDYTYNAERMMLWVK